MKKIGLVILSSILTISSVILLGSTVLASDSSNDGNNITKGGSYGDSKIGINFGNNCLTGMGNGCFDYEKMIGISDEQNKNVTMTSLSQDVILTATYMVGTVLTIVIIYCGLMCIFAAKDGKDGNKYKDYLKNAAIGALLVWGAYAIVRLIQYIAKG